MKMLIDRQNVYLQANTDFKLHAVAFKSYILDNWKLQNNKAEDTITIIYTCIYIRLHCQDH